MIFRFVAEVRGHDPFINTQVAHADGFPRCIAHTATETGLQDAGTDNKEFFKEQ